MRLHTPIVLPACLAVSLFAAHVSGDEPKPAKAPLKVLFGNDTTNITSCVSPYHEKRQGLTDEMLRATIDEAAGADVHMLQPGCGWIPWWKSEVYPATEHYRYYEEEYGIKPNAYGQYMLSGGDLIETFVSH